MKKILITMAMLVFVACTSAPNQETLGEFIENDRNASFVDDSTLGESIENQREANFGLIVL